MNEMKKILLIGTGGTIASDVTDSGLAPELTTEQLLSHIPGISDIWRSPPVSGTTTAAMTALLSPTARTPWRIRRRP